MFVMKTYLSCEVVLNLAPYGCTGAAKSGRRVGLEEEAELARSHRSVPHSAGVRRESLPAQAPSHASDS